MTCQEFVELLGSHPCLETAELKFNLFDAQGREVILRVDGIDEASDETFIGVNLIEDHKS